MTRSGRNDSGKGVVLSQPTLSYRGVAEHPAPPSRSSGQYDENPYLCSRSSIVSSPKFTTSFNPKDIVYPSCKVSSHHPRPASEMKYRSPGAALQRKQSACSLAALRDQGCYKSFQDPVQKTYSGDLLQKHSQHFTQDKPFTPKTLKSDKSSYLSKFRYYRAPRRKPTQDCSSSILMRQETYHGSTTNKEDDTQELEPSQEYSTEHMWSDDEVNGTYFSPSRKQSQMTKRNKHYFFGSSSRILPEDGESPIMRHVSAEEEELMYLQFISAVTEDILSRGHISERVINRVMKRHLDMNLHQLDEGKMRHLLEVLRKEFEKPTNTSASEPEIKENCLLDTIFSHLQSSGEKRVKPKEDNDPFSNAPLISSNLPDYPDPFLVSVPVWSPERTTSVSINEKDNDSDNEENSMVSPLFTENVFKNADINQSDFHQGDTTTIKEIYSDDKHTTTNSDTETDQERIHFDGQSKELEDLGRSLSEMLHVSSNTHSDSEEAAIGQHINTVASGSDDEF
ncbi:spermatogenesis-associated protein 7 homolog isoform X2 [Melanotaenia boesemani]|uniref:spermatogenesis-associated protein 7 homolog isoform X2 n=1 Tax=Melanotaenia boesemani TaxID=1250792 RepID=UPI001C0552E5|nr:spermatogenesis-associated protein 7 homolog isoform X2 [Melanotaenia boesemani]